MAIVLDDDQRRFIEARRTATLATLAGDGRPRLVPVCFVLLEGMGAAGSQALFSPLDEKPKRGDVRRLARVRDIGARPGVTLLFERWSEDWSALAWLRVRGTARLVEPDDADEAHGRAIHGLRARYPQYRGHDLEASPMIRIDIDEVLFWSA